MSGAALDRLDAGSLFVAVSRGWAVGVLAGVPVVAVYMLWSSAALSSMTIGQLLLSVPQALVSLLILVALGGVASLPGPILSVGMLWLAERISCRTRNLPFWIGTGLVASLPTAGFVWYLGTANSAWADRSGLPKPFAWDSLQLPMLILACGLAAALVGWRTQVKLTG